MDNSLNFARASMHMAVLPWTVLSNALFAVQSAACLQRNARAVLTRRLNVYKPEVRMWLVPHELLNPQLRLVYL